jgi:hypothetical protein
MATEKDRQATLDRIRTNIVRHGRHIYLISGQEVPRFGYTIGVSESVGFELVLPGAIFYTADEVMNVLNSVADQLNVKVDRQVFEVDGIGSFTTRDAHESWSQELMLGAFDYYQNPDIRALQVVPDTGHWTIDVPNMSSPWDATKEPVWRFLNEPWTLPVPQDSTAATNLAALRGARITEVTRWEQNEWEMFAGAGTDVADEDMRIVSVGALVAVDPTLAPALALGIGHGIWRDSESDSSWSEWHTRGLDKIC